MAAAGPQTAYLTMQAISTGLVGATGVVGRYILRTLLSHPQISTVSVHSRKPLPSSDVSKRLDVTVNANSSDWPASIASKPAATVFFSALATNRAAGGDQLAIDLELNVALAQAAFAAGTKVYVLISALGANPASRIGYAKVKGELEEAVARVGFDATIVLRPGMIVGGERESMGVAERVLRGVAGGMGMVAAGLKDSWAQEAEVVARAAVAAGLAALEGEAKKSEFVVVAMADIVRLGRTEWTEG